MTKFLTLIPLAIFGLARVALADTPGTTNPPNPLGDIDTIPKLIVKILEIVAQIGLPVVAVAIVYVGFLFVFARGNEEQLKKAKFAFIWTVVGASIVLGAWVISQAICDTVEGMGGEPCQ